MLKLPDKYKSIATVIGAVIIVLLFINFVLKPLVYKITSVQEKIKQAELQLKEGLKVQAQKDEILNAYNRYQEYLKQEDLPEREIVGNFLEELEKIAQQSRVSVISLSPSGVEEKDSFKIYNADFRAEGKMPQLLAFFNKVQQSKLLIKVYELSMSPKDKIALELKLDAKISMIIP